MAAFAMPATDDLGQPRYRWIREQLVKTIVDRRLKGGDSLPSEGQLAKHFGVALGTLRKAVDDLVARNVLERRHGKGLFVAAYDADAALRLFRIANEDGTKELPRFESLLGIRVRPATSNERSRLSLEKSDKVVELRRTRAFSDGALMLETICLPAHRMPDFRQRLGQQKPVLLYEFYAEEYRIHILSVVSRVRAVTATPDDQEHLGVAKGSPLLEVERVAFELGANPLELRITRCDTTGGRCYLDPGTG